jgi:hypothetical protein
MNELIFLIKKEKSFANKIDEKIKIIFKFSKFQNFKISKFQNFKFSNFYCFN